MDKKYICPKCGNELFSSRSTICRDCYLKTLKGSGNPMYGNRFAKKYHCIDCNKLVTSKSYKRCHSCACKHIWKTSESMKSRDLQGENNPNYIHGKSNEPYSLEFNQNLKDRIRKRDNYTCQYCDMTEKEHLTIVGIKLTVHHIDYNKHNCDENNLITLCNKCNIKANIIGFIG